jgi:hypothetical protein
MIFAGYGIVRSWFFENAGEYSLGKPMPKTILLVDNRDFYPRGQNTGLADYQYTLP